MTGSSGMTPAQADAYLTAVEQRLEASPLSENWKRQLAMECFALLQDCIDIHEKDLVQYVESPIELKFILAFGMAMKLWGRDWHFWASQTAFQAGHKEAEISIIPQFCWRDYRSDFCLGGRLAARLILIECDGHDYHERTKEQAIHDRRRDADAQLDGYAILRITGSEIHNDPMGCVVLAFDFAKCIGRPK